MNNQSPEVPRSPFEEIPGGSQGPAPEQASRYELNATESLIRELEGFLRHTVLQTPTKADDFIAAMPLTEFAKILLKGRDQLKKEVEKGNADPTSRSIAERLQSLIDNQLANLLEMGVGSSSSKTDVLENITRVAAQIVAMLPADVVPERARTILENLQTIVGKPETPAESGQTAGYRDRYKEVLATIEPSDLQLLDRASVGDLSETQAAAVEAANDRLKTALARLADLVSSLDMAAHTAKGPEREALQTLLSGMRSKVEEWSDLFGLSAEFSQDLIWLRAGLTESLRNVVSADQLGPAVDRVIRKLYQMSEKPPQPPQPPTTSESQAPLITPQRVAAAAESARSEQSPRPTMEKSPVDEFGRDMLPKDELINKIIKDLNQEIALGKAGFSAYEMSRIGIEGQERVIRSLPEEAREFLGAAIIKEVLEIKQKSRNAFNAFSDIIHSNLDNFDFEQILDLQTRPDQNLQLELTAVTKFAMDQGWIPEFILLVSGETRDRLEKIQVSSRGLSETLRENLSGYFYWHQDKLRAFFAHQAPQPLQQPQPSEQAQLPEIKVVNLPTADETNPHGIKLPVEPRRDEQQVEEPAPVEPLEARSVEPKPTDNKPAEGQPTSKKEIDLKKLDGLKFE